MTRHLPVHNITSVAANTSGINNSNSSNSKYISTPQTIKQTNSSLYVSPSKQEKANKQRPHHHHHHIANLNISNNNNNNNTSENQPLLSSNGEMSDDHMDESDFVHLSCNHFDSDPEFSEMVKMVEFAIDHSILPQRIYEGSSGSYFCKNSDNVKAFSYIYFLASIFGRQYFAKYSYPRHLVRINFQLSCMSTIFRC